jgi:hypothetical protein
MASSHFRIRLSALVAILLGLQGPGVMAQQTASQLPEYTEQERWERSVWQGDLNFIMGLRLARSMGMSVEEYGRQLGLLYAPSWGSPGTRTPAAVFGAIRRNFLSWPNGEVTLVSSSDDVVVGRSNRPYVTSFGESGVFGTVSLDDYERAFDIVMSVIMDYLGLNVEFVRDGGYQVFTIRSRPAGHVPEFGYAVAGPAGRDATGLTGAWEGSYTCRGLPRAANLDLVGDGHGSVSGTLTFGRHPDGPDFETGTYRVKGTLDRDGALALQPDGWVERPGDYLAQALRARVADDGRGLNGEVINYACGSFTARKR